MSESERIKKLENLLLKLVDALRRKDSEKAEFWSWTSFQTEIREIHDEVLDMVAARLALPPAADTNDWSSL